MQSAFNNPLNLIQPAKVAQWLRDLLEGLVFLETHNVVHRDLKLDNLLMDDNGSVVISDFGNAVVLDDTMKLQYIQGMIIIIHVSHQ